MNERNHNNEPLSGKGSYGTVAQVRENSVLDGVIQSLKENQYDIQCKLSQLIVSISNLDGSANRLNKEAYWKNHIEKEKGKTNEMPEQPGEGVVHQLEMLTVDQKATLYYIEELISNTDKTVDFFEKQI